MVCTFMWFLEVVAKLLDSVDLHLHALASCVRTVATMGILFLPARRVFVASLAGSHMFSIGPVARLVDPDTVLLARAREPV
jgi:hypothetical protein